MPFIIPFVYSLAGLGAGFGARIGWTLGGRAMDALDEAMKADYPPNVESTEAAEVDEPGSEENAA